jgi:hypothetical protein
MEENGNCDQAEMRAAWEHILTFDHSIPANARAMAEARQRLAQEPSASPAQELPANLKNSEKEGEANQ